MKNVSIFSIILLFLPLAYAHAQTETERNKATILACYDALNRKDWAGFAAKCAPNYTDINVGPAPAVGVDAALGLYQQFQAAFPDFRVDIKEIVPASPTRFFLRVTVSGTNTGSFNGLPPTGKLMRFDDSDIVELDASGKIISHAITNNGEPLRQIGYGSLLNPSTQVVMAVYEKFGKGDVPGILAICTDDVLFKIDDRVFDKAQRLFNGKAGTGQFFQELGSRVQYSKFQPVKFIADGDDVITLVEVEYTYLPTGDQYSCTYTHHFRIVNGRIAYFHGLDEFQKMK